jgi:hypothetical protein
MPAERFDFANAQGEKLAALFDRPDGPIRAVALFAHCFTCGKDNKAARLIAHGLTSHGIGVLRFDFTGLGSSEGEFANTTFSSNVDDLVAAADHLRTQIAAPAILIGHIRRPQKACAPADTSTTPPQPHLCDRLRRVRNQGGHARSHRARHQLRGRA